MLRDEPEDIECADVAPQYKAMIDANVMAMMEAAGRLMAVGDELGCASFRCTDGTHTVTIAYADDAGDDEDASNPSAEN